MGKRRKSLAGSDKGSQKWRWGVRIEDLKRFCNDLRKVGIEAMPKEGDTMVIINIANMDFYFYKDETRQYDGWGTGNQDVMKDLGFKIVDPK